MRLTGVLLMFVCLTACNSGSTQQALLGSGQAQIGTDQGLMDADARRQKQAALDADAIMQGMAQARHRAEELARTSR